MTRTLFPLAASIAALLATSAAQTQGVPDAALLERAGKLHAEVPLIDGHNDLPWALRQAVRYDFSKIDITLPQPKLHTDIPRLKAGRLGGQFWSVYVPATLQGEHAVSATLEQVDAVYEMVRRYPETFELARTADDVERIFKTGRLASMMGMEGGHSIDNSLAALRMFSKLGVGYMTLTHGANTAWADSATDDPKANGLTAFGEAVVREMNWLGMLVDLSHVSPDTMEDALRVSAAPVIFSHSSARAICDHPRNVPDAILQRLPRNGGVVMVSFVPGFTTPEGGARGQAMAAVLSKLRRQYANDPKALDAATTKMYEEHPEPKATLAQVADHIDHIRKVAGIDHIGIGSDFDGVESLPEGLENVSTYPALTAELLRRGYGDEDVRKILGKNVLRVMRQAEAVAARLRRERGPSVATIEELDKNR
jgi:membrane dipeptidase